jgi:hypothetical protein
VAQVFSARFTLLLRLVVVVGIALVALASITYRVNARPDAQLAAPVEQSVPFSHKHHVTDDGIDCRYCHTSLVSAYRGGEALRWNRVHDLPDFVYFDHSIHVAKGVGCSTCHGRVDVMPLTWRVISLDMQWCLDCHRAPEKYLRPSDRIFDMSWLPPADQLTRGGELKREYHLRNERELTSCSTCHR